MSAMVEDKLKRVISEHLGVEESKITNSANFADDLDTDSLDALDLLMAINEEFGTRIPAEKLTDIQTVQQMIDEVKASI